MRDETDESEQLKYDGAYSHEAAIREILDAIQKSRDDYGPVFDVVLRNAAQICGAPLTSLLLLNEAGDRLVLKAMWGQPLEHFKIEEHDVPLDSPTNPAKAVREAKTAHVPDMVNSESYRKNDPVRRAVVDKDGIRSLLSVPLLKDGKAIGSIDLFRRESLPFSQRHIEMIEGFAQQAVIAIDNARQFRQVQMQLEREEATREILQVISQSRDDEMPVFETILKLAQRLCNADSAALMMTNKNRTHNKLKTRLGQQLFKDSVIDEWPLDSGQAHTEAVVRGTVIHEPDLRESKLYTEGDETRMVLVDKVGLRTALAVPLLHQGKAIGAFVLHRMKVARAFLDSEIQLIESFATQAVIAIENVRQFNEVRIRLERETATRSILEVIGKSRDNDEPVFQAVLENAARLCAADRAALMFPQAAESLLKMRYTVGQKIPVEISQPGWPIDGPHAPCLAYRSAKPVHIQDLKQSELYLKGDETQRILADEFGIRTVLAVPLLRDEKAIGVIILQRFQISRAFNDADIQLVETFARQAVIAIDSVEQFNALGKLNAELENRVEQQVEEIQRMSKLKRFLPSAVADTVISQGSDKLLSSHRSLLGVLFCDIRGFTAFCETAEPEETIEVLQTYHRELGRLINQHGAGVDHRMGDGIMVLFNDPLPCDDPAGDAVRLAIAMRERMVDLAKRWKRSGYQLGFGVGISLGYATVGLVGHEDRSDYTASGTAINLASRLCDEAEDGEILLSPKAQIAVEDDFETRSRGEMSLKGIRQPLEIFSLAKAIN